MAETPGPDRIEEFLANRCAAPDADAVYAYLLSNQAALDDVKLMEDVNTQDIVERTYEEKQRVLKKVLGVRQIAFSYKKWLVAACITGVLVALAMLVFNPGKQDEMIAVYEKTIMNTTSDLLNYYLPDSSKITLAQGAAVVFKTNYATDRMVQVKRGSVYFKVAKDTLYPFRVIADGISTTAVGTQFWVQQLPDHTLNISLTEGKVYINAADDIFKMDTVFLMPGQNCFINKRTGQVYVTGSRRSQNKLQNKLHMPAAVPAQVAEQSAIVWTNDKILLADAKLKNVFVNLESRYQIKIVALDTSICSASITGQIFYKDSLDILIQSICELNKLSYERNNDTIYLKKN